MGWPLTAYRRRAKVTPAQVHLEREGRCLSVIGAMDALLLRCAGADGAWVVPHQQRHYRLVAETDTLAAKEALRLFGEELDFVTIEV